MQLTSVVFYFELVGAEREVTGMNFSKAIKNVFLKYSNIRGRARRSEYWYFFVLNISVFAVVFALSVIAKKTEWLLLFLLYGVVMLYPSFTVAVRRLHDTGKSGWYIFIWLIPVVGHILLLIWLCEDSEPCANKYGSNPKNLAISEEFLEMNRYNEAEDIPELRREVTGMNFSKAIENVFLKYAYIDGRARRSEYWYFFVLNISVFAVLFALSVITKKIEGLLLFLLYGTGMLFPSLTVAIRRLHDTGKSGWYIFIWLIPVVGQIVLLIWLCEDSEPCANKYGPNPKNLATSEELLEMNRYNEAEDIPELRRGEVKMMRYVGNTSFKIFLKVMILIPLLFVFFVIFGIIEDLVKYLIK